ncbi:hypothetical protein [Nonomuraea ceibae]|uniref:hypothetical protein n=1 Tax=Nonomuraea ceibae TaxID=1935170 RepID=UPI001C5EC353|nr:hypothetical protein [Nonomuraea ceibae]
MRKIAASLTLIVSAFIVTTPSPAAAAPTGCSVWKAYSGSSEGGGAKCTGGTGHFRVLAYCTADPSNGWGTLYRGNWAYPGNYSYKWCPSSQRHVVGVALEKANW